MKIDVNYVPGGIYILALCRGGGNAPSAHIKKGIYIYQSFSFLKTSYFSLGLPSPIPMDSFGERAEGQKPVFVPIPNWGGAELVPLPVNGGG